jgi:hypothetical protein
MKLEIVGERDVECLNEKLDKELDEGSGIERIPARPPICHGSGYGLMTLVCTE